MVGRVVVVGNGCGWKGGARTHICIGESIAVSDVLEVNNGLVKTLIEKGCHDVHRKSCAIRT